MYIRFVCPAAHPHANAELGIFQGTRRIGWEGQPAWLADEYRRAYEAATDGLAVPGCVGWGETADGRRGMCWLRSRNRETVAGFRHLAWVMGEMGVPVAEIHSRDPGRIIYRDPAQVVALPYRGTPRAFPRRVCH